MHVISDVSLFGELRHARVQADPHVDRPSASASVIASAAASLPAPWKRRRRSIALRVHLDPALCGAGLADRAAVLGERVRVPLGTELVQELRRASTSVKRKVTVPEGKLTQGSPRRTQSMGVES